MAESQVPYPYDPAKITALKSALSEARFTTYRKKANGDERFAFALYLYNARLAKSFLFPLNIAEVTLRNAVDGVLQQLYGSTWHQNDQFCHHVLTIESHAALKKARERARSGERSTVIAELTFDFWSNLFREDYATLWRTKANIAFPGLAHGEGRRTIQALAKDINRLRNRVAHHEPILDLNVPDLQSKIIKLIELRCKITADWMRHHATVNIVMRSRPSLAGSAPVTLADKGDRRFKIVAPATSLFDLAADDPKNHVAFICMENNQIIGAITHPELTDYLTTKAREAGGLIDLTEHRVRDMLDHATTTASCRLLAGESPIMDAVQVLKEPQTRLVVAVNPSTGMPVAVLLRAHRRY